MKKKLNILFDGNPSNKYYELIDHLGKVTSYFPEAQLKQYTTFIIDCQSPAKNWNATDFKEILNAGVGLVLLEPNKKNCQELADIVGRKMNGSFHGIITKILKDTHGKPYYYCDAVATIGQKLPDLLDEELIGKLNKRVERAISFSTNPPCDNNSLFPQLDKSPTAIIRDDEFMMNL